jgi:uncharacterized protein (TIGR03435 family)
MALLPVLLFTLPAQVPKWQEFSIGPATRMVDTNTTNLRQGILHSSSISLQALIGVASGVPYERVAGPGWMASDHYAISATLSDATRLRLRTREPDDARVIDEFRALLTEELLRRFQLETHRETRETLGYLLQPSAGGVVALRPPVVGERANLNVTNTALIRRSTLDARGITLRGFGGWLSNHLNTAVTTAESLPEGAHDFQFQWKTDDNESLVAELRSQLGLELVKDAQRQEFVVVDRVERLGGAAAPEVPAPTEPIKAAPDSSVTFTVVQLRKDLRVAREALEEGHPGIYRFTPKAEMDRAFDGLAATLTRPMTALEFYRALAPVVARMKCGHTSLIPSAAIEQRVMAEPLLPIEAAVLGGRVYVARDLSPDGRLAGARLLSINGVAIDQILAAMLAVVHGDGDSATAGPHRLSRGRGFARNLYLIAGLQSPFRLRYSAGDKTTEATVNGLTLKAMQDAETSRHPEPPAAGNATWRVLPGGTTGVLKVRAFWGNAEDGTSLGSFFERVFTEIDAKGLSRLILDLRNNAGGEDELGRRLFAHFADAPFRYYRDLTVNKLAFRFFQYVPERDPLPASIHALVKPASDGKLHVVGHPNWGIQQPASPHFGGKLIVLMNGGSFSTTCEFLATLHHRGGAVFVGEETAGGYYGNSSGASVSVRFPGSKLTLPVQLVGYYLAIDGTQQGTRGIRPDHPVEYSIEDVLAGRDREMEIALGLGAAADRAVAH